MRTIAAVTLWATLLAACGLLPPANLVSPRVSFVDFAVRDIGLSEIRFTMVVSADNPNDVDVPLRDISFQLDLLGSAFAEGSVANGRIDLPARGQREITVDFTASTTSLLAVFERLQATGRADPLYRLRGTASWGRSGVPIRFERSGDLESLRRLGEILGREPTRSRGPAPDRGARPASAGQAISS